MSELAMTSAFRGMASIRLISPKTSPGPTVSISLSSRLTMPVAVLDHHGFLSMFALFHEHGTLANLDLGGHGGEELKLLLVQPPK